MIGEAATGEYGMLDDLKTEIEKIVRPILTEESFDLVETKLSRYRQRYRLQLFIDSDQGVNVDDCARFSGLIGTALEMTDLMDEGYLLEVSSPGIDRPLKSEADFKRRIGREIRIEMNENGTVKSVQGKLDEVSGGTLALTGKKGQIKIALTDVVQGREII